MRLDPPPHVMLVVAPYYAHITDQMVQGAMAVLTSVGATAERFDVAGAFELPVAIRLGLDASEAQGGRKPFDGYVALGCVIRGETTHYDHICEETTRALQDLSVGNRLALGYGLLTCENEAQALARADINRKNKGAEAARACLKTLEVKARLGLYPG
jgi:6,7-dimethyl-8-ribityllumazine synthase